MMSVHDAYQVSTNNVNTGGQPMPKFVTVCPKLVINTLYLMIPPTPPFPPLFLFLLLTGGGMGSLHYL